MKKLLLALPLIVGTSWAGTSYYAGTSTQDAYTDLLKQLNEFKPFTLVNEQYSAGLANSTAITSVMASAASDAKVLFRLQHDINHSPVGLKDSGVRFGAATIKTSLLLPDASSNSMFQGFSSAEPVVINTEVQFNGIATHQLLVSTFEMLEDDGSIRFDGMEYTAVVNGDAITGTGVIGEFTVDSPLASIRLAPGDIDVDLEKFADGLYSGGYSLSFNEASIESAVMPFGLGIQDIYVSSDTKINGSTFDTNGTISLGNIDSPLPVNNASVKFGVNNLSIEGSSKYLNIMSQFSALDENLATNPDYLKQWSSAIAKVFGPNAGVTYEIDFNNDGGNANLKVNVGVIDGASPNYPLTGLQSITTVRELLSVTEAELRFHADAAALDQTPLAALLVSPQTEQFVLADGITYQSLIKTKDLIVDVNGNPLSLELIMGDTLDMTLFAIADI